MTPKKHTLLPIQNQQQSHIIDIHVLSSYFIKKSIRWIRCLP